MSDRPTPPDGEWSSFAMGEHSAQFPSDRKYATNHMWGKEVEPSRWRFGLTAYAVRLLQDVYFLDWIVEPPAALTPRANIGSIESKKAESDLYAPIAGMLVGINETVLSDPSLINADTYEQAWLIEIKSVAAEGLLAPGDYAAHLLDAWDVAQRTIKGQASQED